MRKIRHMIYWAVVISMFLPLFTLATAASIYDFLQSPIYEFKHWAFQERYVRILR